MRTHGLMVLSIVVSMLLAGCGPMMREAQFTNMRTALFPMRMEVRTGQGQVDARKLLKAQTYEGKIERPDVVVHYPPGMSELAFRVADAFESAGGEVKRRTGITWAFKPVLYLVPVSSNSGGFRLSIPIRKSRELEIPILVSGGEIMPSWSRGIAHELTEASMLASLSRRELVLGDYCLWGSGLVNETRWFRDGVSEYAGDILNERIFGERYQAPPWIYAELARVREGLLDWNNCVRKVGPQDYYDASLALVRELENRFGEGAIARIMQAASEDKYIDGRILRRAVKRVTGVELAEFLREYRQTWLGMELEDTRKLSGPVLVAEGNRVRVARVYPGTPADKWKLRAGDVIESIDGRPAISAAWIVHYIAVLKPRDRVQVEVLRDGQRYSCRMAVMARSKEEL